MRTPVDVDTIQLDHWLINKSIATGKGLGEVLREEASFVMETVTRLTPPTDGTMTDQQSWATQRKMGRNAIIGDLARVYTTSASLAKAIRESGENGVDGAKAFNKAVRTGNIAEAQRLLYAFDLGEHATGVMGQFDATYHTQRRTRRGRVSRSGYSVIVTNSPALNAYKRAQLAKVGQLKKGWAMASKSLKRKPRIPAWISKAQGRAGGAMRDHTRNAVDPYINLANTSPHAESQNRVLRFSDMALRLREGKIRRAVEHMMDRTWKKG